MKTVAQLMFPLALLLGACAGQDNKPDNQVGGDDCKKDGSTATDTVDSPDDSFPEDSDPASADTSNADDDSDSGYDGAPLDTASPGSDDHEDDTDQDGESDVDTADQDPPDLDTASTTASVLIEDTIPHNE